MVCAQHEMPRIAGIAHEGVRCLFRFGNWQAVRKQVVCEKIRIGITHGDRYACWIWKLAGLHVIRSCVRK